MCAGYRIRFIVDLHGCAAYRDFGLALGTLHGQSCPAERSRILSLLHQFGFRPNGPWLSVVDVDRTFTANGRQGQETITRFAWQRLGVAAAQFELHPHLRVVRRLGEASEREPYQAQPAQITRTVAFFLALVTLLAEGYRENATPAETWTPTPESEEDGPGRED